MIVIYLVLSLDLFSFGPILNCARDGKVRGLCGNFNDNALDDFQTPSGGITEVDAKTFGDSWRLQKYCPETTDYIVIIS